MAAKKSYKKVPNIKTKLPGPNAKKLIQTDALYLSPSYTREYPLAVKRGLGAVIEDMDGNVFLDFTSGIAVCATGHCHPKVVKAVHKQSSMLMHMSGTDFYYAPQRDLAVKLAQLAPGKSRKRVFFTNSGAESVEAAFKLARYHTKRQHMIAFFGAFHGRTMGALSLTGSKVTQRRGFAPLVPGVTHAEFPNVYRRPKGLTPEEYASECIRKIEKNLFKRTVPPKQVAAVIVEPIQGEGGYIVPPPNFHKQLRALTKKHGILYIADEVQTGMGRTGKMFASEHFGIEPDILCTAKGIASGMPLGAIVAKAEIMDWAAGSHASTFGGNPVSCAASLATIELLQKSLIKNSAKVGEFLMKKLREMQKRRKLIGFVRGKGLMIGIELVKNRDKKTPAPDIRDEVVQRAFKKGLLLLGCGETAIRFCPPLVINRREAQTALDIFEEVLAEFE